jgi:pyruvate/2-oxoglutarate dehydrogenase complex dihydrolipoamide acyltransferase (E2) component
MRATIARRLLESKNTVPHFYLEVEVDAAPLMGLRETLNKRLAEQGGETALKLSVNDFTNGTIVAQNKDAAKDTVLNLSKVQQET